MATSSTYSNTEMAGATVLTIPLMVSANRVKLKRNLALWHSHVFVDRKLKKYCQDKHGNDDLGEGLRGTVTADP